MENLDYQQLKLRDGRTLAYAQFGSPGGDPIMYCHGTPSSRVEGRLTVSARSTAQLGVRIIIPDRPGMGRSDFQPRRRIIDWPADVVELADSLHLERFSVLGSSGGSPYALACGAFLPHRVRAVGIVGGVAPSNAPGLASAGSGFLGRMARDASPVVRALIRLQLLALRSAAVRKSMANAFPEPDRTLLQRDDIREGFIGCLEECCRHGTRGAVWEMGLFSRPWGFELSRIRVPVFLWQGERDGNVSAEQGRYLAQAVPHCRAKFYPDDAHLSVMLNHQADVFEELLGRSADAVPPSMGLT